MCTLDVFSGRQVPRSLSLSFSFRHCRARVASSRSSHPPFHPRLSLASSRSLEEEEEEDLAGRGREAFGLDATQVAYPMNYKIARFLGKLPDRGELVCTCACVRVITSALLARRLIIATRDAMAIVTKDSPTKHRVDGR